MNRRLSKKQEVIRRTAVYSATSLAVVAIATFLIFIILGYRLDTKNGQIEQNALVQFDTSPTGATVTIDEEVLGSSTTTKATVSPRNHHFTFKKDGYETWNKDLDTLSGTLYWLDYAILIPKSRNAEPVQNYAQLDSSLASPKSRYMLVHRTTTDSSFDVVDLKNDNISVKTVTLPAPVVNGLISKKGLKFTPLSWDSGERYVLVKATTDTLTQWIVLDTKAAENSKNISTSLDIDFTDIKFYDTSGNIFYGLSSGDLRKIDLAAGTISRSFVTKVDHFTIFDSKWILYNGRATSGSLDLPVAGIYRDGDDNPTNVLTGTKNDEKVYLTGSNYRSKDYLAIAHGQSVDLYQGVFPGFGDNFSETMKLENTFSLDGNLDTMSFSENADYLLMRAGLFYNTYYLEHKLTYKNNLDAGAKLIWLNTDYLWSDFEGSFTIREFDGANNNIIMSSVTSQDALLTSNNKYIYAFQKNTAGYSLSRVKLVIN
jgi:hypothetical protein